MSSGIVFSIQRFCVDDGPGIRTTVFLKGCPLRCVWCHNAEGLQKGPELSFSSEKCSLCGLCAKVCPRPGCHVVSPQGHTIRRADCRHCGACVKACPNGALSLLGRRMRAEDVLCEVLEDKPFYDRSGGGVTLSGGEPLSQPEFALALARLSKENGLHVCVETSGCAKTDDLTALAAYTDLFLYDFKLASSADHRRFTSADNDGILRNLAVLGERGVPVILRCPLIPHCNDTEAHLRAVADLAAGHPGIREIHLEPYHPFGLDKYAALGKKARYENREMMPAEDVGRLAAFLRSLTDIPVSVL